jgi:hypothetical protein
MSTSAPVYDDTGNVIETDEHKGDFKKVVSRLAILSPFTGYLPLWRQK